MGRGRLSLRLGLLLLALAPALGFAQARALGDKPLLRWLVQDIPPHFSYPGGRMPQQPEELGHGEIDGFMRVLLTRMPQFRHEFFEASLPRFEMLARQGEPVCSMLHLRTAERLSWLYFTPIYPPLASRELHVIVRREQLARFEVQGQTLQLSDLLQRPELVGLLQRDRSYGPRIDALLQAQGGKGPRTVVGVRGLNLLTMLRAGRMDYTIDYPSVLDEYQRSQGRGAAGELVALPVVEGRSTQMATAGCSRSPAGRRAIEALDAAVRALAQEPQREAWQRAWRGEALDDGDRQRLNRFMDERARGGPQIE